jgi:hypothetical protein
MFFSHGKCRLGISYSIGRILNIVCSTAVFSKKMEGRLFLLPDVTRERYGRPKVWTCFILSKLHPPYNNLSSGCGLVQQVVKCSAYYNNLTGGCGLVQQVVKCSN